MPRLMLVVTAATGAKSGGFSFQVNDGVNYGKKSIFVINSRPLVVTVLKEVKAEVS